AHVPSVEQLSTTSTSRPETDWASADVTARRTMSLRLNTGIATVQVARPLTMPPGSVRTRRQVECMAPRALCIRTLGDRYARHGLLTHHAAFSQPGWLSHAAAS